MSMKEAARSVVFLLGCAVTATRAQTVYAPSVKLLYTDSVGVSWVIDGVTGDFWKSRVTPPALTRIASSLTTERFVAVDSRTGKAVFVDSGSPAVEIAGLEDDPVSLGISANGAAAVALTAGGKSLSLVRISSPFAWAEVSREMPAPVRILEVLADRSVLVEIGGSEAETSVLTRVSAAGEEALWRTAGPIYCRSVKATGSERFVAVNGVGDVVSIDATGSLTSIAAVSAAPVKGLAVIDRRLIVVAAPDGLHLFEDGKYRKIESPFLPSVLTPTADRAIFFLGDDVQSGVAWLAEIGGSGVRFHFAPERVGK